MDVKAVGILGAGKLGVVLAQLALKAGYEVYISASGDPSKIQLTTEVLAPGAKAMTNTEVAHAADVLILALPLNRFRQIPPDALAGKLVIDATNYWWEVDGPRDEILPDTQSSSEAVQEFFADSRVVKALSHMSYHDLYDEAKSAGATNRKAIAIAGDTQEDVKVVSEIINKLGFDPLFIGPLAAGRRLEPGSPAFGASVDINKLQQLMN